MKITDVWRNDSGLLTVADFNLIQFSRNVPLSLVGVDQNVLNFWRREELLPFIPKGKWARVTYMQILWIWVLDAMRRLNISVNSMKDLKEYFITRAVNDNLARQNLEFHKNRLESKAKLTPLPLEDLELLTRINRDLENEEVLTSYGKDINYFTNLVTESILSGKEAGILIFPGLIAVYLGKDIYPSGIGLHWDKLEHHVNIPLKPLLARFIQTEKLAEFQKAMDFPTDEELQVIRHLRSKTIKKIEITRPNNKQNIRIDTTETGHITDDQAEEIKKVLGLHNYESITIDTMDDSNLVFKRTKKHINGF